MCPSRRALPEETIQIAAKASTSHPQRADTRHPREPTRSERSPKSMQRQRKPSGATIANRKLELARSKGRSRGPVQPTHRGRARRRRTTGAAPPCAPSQRWGGASTRAANMGAPRKASTAQCSVHAERSRHGGGPPRFGRPQDAPHGGRAMPGMRPSSPLQRTPPLLNSGSACLPKSFGQADQPTVVEPEPVLVEVGLSQGCNSRIVLEFASGVPQDGHPERAQPPPG